METFLSRNLEDILMSDAPDAGSTCPASALGTLRQLFAAARQHVPAYAEHAASAKEAEAHQGAGASAAAGPSGGDPLHGIPYTTKESYYGRHPLAARCWGGSLAGADFVHFSSGSSGRPTPWARCADDEGEVAARFEQVLRDSFACHERSSLCVVALPLGSWVGGVFTTMCLRLLSLKGYRLVVTTPGNRVPEIIQIIESLGPSCDQTVILGYPPFVKAVIDEGLAQGVEWGRYALKLVLAGEVFSEDWRALMAARGAIAEPHRGVASIYGTADAGVIAVETPLSALVRGWLSAHPEHARALFGRERLPTLAQYDPRNRFLELHPEDGTIVVSSLPGDGRAEQLREAAAAAPGPPPAAGGGGGACALRGAPLLRYCIGDAGGVVGFDEMASFLAARGYDPLADGRCAPVRRLPFVWVFGRSFWAVSLYGANVYVEQVMPAFEGGGEEEQEEQGGEGGAEGGGGGGGGGRARLSDLLTGKFVLYVEEDADANPRLALRAETARGVAPGGALAARAARAVRAALLRASSEYAAYVPQERQLPAVHVYAHSDPQHFPPGVKHRYTLV
ncbi:MAG: hypothetical protein J3K34DRAFT_519546 [Monoraphidium minutum]|nr:MAG: hypothetical protein J3K34DRAFT_519546 [Monoraphidium minutum]